MKYKNNSKYNKNSRGWVNLATMPFIWTPFFPTLVADLTFEIYQAVCFPIYGLEKVKRSDYIQVIDRNKLQYLKWYEKLGCMYCGYMNGVFRYFKEISGRTESYWCGIMHEKKEGFVEQEHQIRQDFAAFGDEKKFNEKFRQ